MGTTLTGTTPQDTYDSLIKVTDNGPLSGTSKYLSDGLGNDSVLALSTTALGIGTTSLSGKFHAQATNSGIFFDLTTAYTPKIKAAGAISDLQIESVGSGGNLILGAGGAASIMTFFTNGDSSTGERMRITSAGNVGIGTTAPAALLSLSKSADASILVNTATTGTFPIKSGISFGSNSTSLGGDAKYTGGAGIQGVNTAQSDNVTDLLFWTTAGGSPSEKVRVLSSGGITFNGDTAAANALDDYEEGTWTIGVSFGGASVGVTTSANTGTYTKIGRQVTVNGSIVLTSQGSSTGSANITGLPFALGSTQPFRSCGSFRFFNISFTNQFQGFAIESATTILLREITLLGTETSLDDTNFANDSQIIVSLTYFV